MSVIKKIFAVNLPYVQVLFVFMAFTAMVIAGFFFGRQIDLQRVERESEFVTRYVEAKLNADLRELEAILAVMSETVRDMISRGAELDEIKEYAEKMTAYGQGSDKFVGFVSFFALFEPTVFDSDLYKGYSGFSGMGEFPVDFIPDERPWYIVANRLNKEIEVSKPYIDVMSGKMIFAYVSNVFDDNGERLAIICLNVALDSIYELSYENLGDFVNDWMLFDDELNLVSYTNESFIGIPLRDFPDELADIADLLEQEESISGHRYLNYLDETKIIAVERLENGWYIGVTTLLDGHLDIVSQILWTLILLSGTMAALLSFALINIAIQRNKAEKRANLMLNLSPLGINLIDKSFKLIDCNVKALDMFGFTKASKSEYLARFREFSPEKQPNGEESAVLQKHYLDTALKDGSVTFEWTHRKPDGRVEPFEITATRTTYNGEDVVLAYMNDLSELRNTMSELRETQERSLLMFDSTPLCINFWDKNYKIIDCNQTAVDFFKLKDKQEYLERFFDLSPECQPCGTPSAKKAKELIDLALEQGCCYSEWTNQMLSGEPVPCELTIVRVKHNDEFVVVVYMRDLREHKQFLEKIKVTNERLRRARDSAEESSRTKSAFLANMSHEIRTPMNSVIGFSELAQYGEMPDKTRDYLFKIQNSAEWLLRIIDDILDISKIESGKISLEHISFDLHKVLSHCQSSIANKAAEKGITLYCYAEPSIGSNLSGDPIRLRQAIVNLLSNAVKFTNSGMVKFLASIVRSDEKTTTIAFEVKDSGIGMSPEQIAKVFDPFIQGDDSITRRFGGTGLGLAITKSIIELMGGTLVVESAVGIGSRFTFELTFDLIDGGEGVVAEEKIIVDSDNKPNFKGEVLVCEDNSLNQQVITDHLERVGIRPVIAENGKEGIDILTERMKNPDGSVNYTPFDLILMDIHMPVMDGLEAASKIKEMGIKTPVVAITANIMSNDIELYKTGGMSDCIGKPFTAKTLWSCLVKYLKIEQNGQE
jgi:PAS domain S-box-containing protein